MSLANFPTILSNNLMELEVKIEVHKKRLAELINTHEDIINQALEYELPEFCVANKLYKIWGRHHIQHNLVERDNAYENYACYMGALDEETRKFIEFVLFGYVKHKEYYRLDLIDRILKYVNQISEQTDENNN